MRESLLNKRKLQSVWPRFVLTTLVETVEKRFERERQTLVPQDFNQIADHSRPRNYVGFIYADGNRMGEIIASMGTQFPDDKDAKQAYKAFSAITDEATRQAAVHGVKSHADTTPRGEPARFIPAESVLQGGDDRIPVVPAHTALQVATRFISVFQERTKELQRAWVERGNLRCPFAPEGLTTSAGVVLAHAFYPAS
jgi:CRISPR-associated protein Cmr2